MYFAIAASIGGQQAIYIRVRLSANVATDRSAQLVSRFEESRGIVAKNELAVPIFVAPSPKRMVGIVQNGTVSHGKEPLRKSGCVRFRPWAPTYADLHVGVVH